MCRELSFKQRTRDSRSATETMRVSVREILRYQKPRKTSRNSWETTKTKLNYLRCLPRSYLRIEQKPILSAPKALMYCATLLYQQNGWHCSQWFKANHHCLCRYRCCYCVECFLRHVDHWVVIWIRIWQKLQVAFNLDHCRTTGEETCRTLNVNDHWFNILW